jgi:hypothetical protein
MKNRSASQLLVCAAVVGVLVPIPISAAPSDDAYLREIQAEGSKLETLNKAREEIRQGEAREKAAGKTGAVAADVKGFEKLLNADAQASYSIYLRLKPEQKTAVFDAYRKQGKLSDAKRKVVDLFLGM